MTDQEIIAIFHRIVATYKREREDVTYWEVCQCISALMSEPIARVTQVCIDEEMP